jgi:hypothetical protein
LEILIGGEMGLEEAFNGFQALFGRGFEGDADFFSLEADEDLVIAQLGRGEEGAFDDEGVFSVVVVDEGLGDEGGLGELEAGGAEAEDGQEKG